MRKCTTCGYTVSEKDWESVALKRPICVGCGNISWEYIPKQEEHCPKCNSQKLEITLDILIDDDIKTVFEYDDKGTVNIRFECSKCLYCWSRFYIPREDQNVVSEYSVCTRGTGQPLPITCK